MMSPVMAQPCHHVVPSSMNERDDESSPTTTSAASAFSSPPYGISYSPPGHNGHSGAEHHVNSPQPQSPVGSAVAVEQRFATGGGTGASIAGGYTVHVGDGGNGDGIGIGMGTTPLNGGPSNRMSSNGSGSGSDLSGGSGGNNSDGVRTTRRRSSGRRRRNMVELGLVVASLALVGMLYHSVHNFLRVSSAPPSGGVSSRGDNGLRVGAAPRNTGVAADDQPKENENVNAEMIQRQQQPEQQEEGGYDQEEDRQEQENRDSGVAARYSNLIAKAQDAPSVTGGPIKADAGVAVTDNRSSSARPFVPPADGGNPFEINLGYPFTMLADVGDMPVESTDVIFFWHVPKAAGSTVKDVLDFCFDLVRAEKVRHPESLEIVQFTERHRLVNMDTNSTASIEKARAAGLVQSGIPQVIVSSYLHEAATLFSPDHRGRTVTVLRHPIERAVSLYHYQSKATWEPTYSPSFAQMTLLEYGQSGTPENNWLTRYLTQTKRGQLSHMHVQMATEVLRQKCLVGLVDEMEESMRRVQAYFGLTEKAAAGTEKEGVGSCVGDYLDRRVNAHSHEKIEEGSEEWDLFARINLWDMLLYENAKEIFGEQLALFAV